MKPETASGAPHTEKSVGQDDGVPMTTDNAQSASDVSDDEISLAKILEQGQARLKHISDSQQQLRQGQQRQQQRSGDQAAEASAEQGPVSTGAEIYHRERAAGQYVGSTDVPALDGAVVDSSPGASHKPSTTIEDTQDQRRQDLQELLDSKIWEADAAIFSTGTRLQEGRDQDTDDTPAQEHHVAQGPGSVPSPVSNGQTEAVSFPGLVLLPKEYQDHKRISEGMSQLGVAPHEFKIRQTPEHTRIDVARVLSLVSRTRSLMVKHVPHAPRGANLPTINRMNNNTWKTT